MANRIQLRRGTAAEWAAKNPILAAGEPGVETDTGQEKFGDGVTRWNARPYAKPGLPGPAGKDGSNVLTTRTAVAAELADETSPSRTVLSATTAGLVGPLVAEAIADDPTVANAAAAAAEDAVAIEVSSGGILKEIKFRGYAADLSFASFPFAGGTFTYSNKVLTATATDQTKYYCAVTAEPVSEATLTQNNPWMVIGATTTTVIGVEINAAAGARSVVAFDSAGAFLNRPATATAVPLTGKKVKLVYTAAEVVITYSTDNGVTWLPWLTLSKATYGITSDRVGAVDRSTVKGPVTIEAMPLGNSGSIVPSTIPESTVVTGDRFILLADLTTPSKLSKVKSEVLTGGPLTFAAEVVPAFTLAVNPGNNYQFTYDAASALLAVSAITPGANGAPYAAALNDVELAEVVYSWGAMSQQWIIIGSDASGRAYMLTPATFTNQVQRINLDGSLTVVASAAPISGAAPRGGRVRVVWTALTVDLYEWHNEAWLLWKQVTKSAAGITRHRAGAASAAGASVNDQRFRVFLRMKGAVQTGKVLDVNSVQAVTSATLAASDGVLLYSDQNVSGIRRMTMSQLLNVVGEGSKRWAGKKIYLYGDSISSTDYSWYGPQLAAKTGATVQVGGRSGATVSGLTNNAWLDSVVAFAPDLVICMSAGNDTGQAGTVGTFVPSNTNGEALVSDPNVAAAYAGTKFIEAVAYIVQYLNSKLYKAANRPKIIYLDGTPQHRNSHSLTDAWNNPANHERKAAAVREVCARYHAPYLDMLTRCGWDMSQEPFWTAPTDKVTNNGTYTMDGLHPNQFGYERMTDIIADFIKGI